MLRLLRALFCCTPRGRIQVACDCPVCGHQHTYRQCPEFLKLKNRTSLVSYHEMKPRREEEAGFMAAGIFLVNEFSQALMIKESRIKNGQRLEKYNFIGGKRECRLDCFGLPRLERGFETASAEFEEETGVSLPGWSYENVYWFPESKFLLFVIRGTVAPKKEVEWLDREEIEQGMREGRFHDYMVSQLAIVLDL